MKDNVIQFPGVSEREWSKIEDSIRSSHKKDDIPQDFTDELCHTMKVILLEANKAKDFSVSYDGDIHKTVVNAAEQVSAHYKSVVEGLINEIVKREIELYKFRNGYS
jgi:hypothetical protein